MKAQQILFKEWLPDLPALNNPGLIEATNLTPTDDGYRPFYPLNNAYSTAPAAITDAYVANGATKGSARVYVLTGGRYAAVPPNSGSSYATIGSLVASRATFAQYENLVFAAGANGHRLARHTLNSATTMAEVTAAPYADTVGVVGQFVVVGALYEDEGSGTITATKSNYIQWPAIDDPTNWPTPGSSTAIAAQAGEQALYTQFGQVMAIHGGDQYGVLLQKRAITRMTYVGGASVWQFDLIDKENGSEFKNGSVDVSGMTYFISQVGFCRTNGSAVERIGAGKVDAYFWANTSVSDNVSAAYDAVNGLVCWGTGDQVYKYNPRTGWWTVCTQSHSCIIRQSVTVSRASPLFGYSSGSTPILGVFSATAGTAVVTTGEAEFVPGEFSHLSGVKPIVSGAATITVAVGTRNDQATTPSYTSETSPTARTGFADFRSEARYHRARFTITGDFTKAIGAEFKVVESGDT